MSRLLDRKLLSIFCLPGHHMPGTPPHCAAAVIKRIGFPVRFASARPSFKTPYQAMPGTTFLLVGTLPPYDGPLGGASCALAGVVEKETSSNQNGIDLIDILHSLAVGDTTFSAGTRHRAFVMVVTSFWSALYEPARLIRSDRSGVLKVSRLPWDRVRTAPAAGGQ